MKLNPLILVLFLNIVLLIFISSIIASGFVLFNFNFWGSFLVSFGIISIIGYISNKIIENKYSVVFNKLRLEQEKIIADQNISLSCSYCKTNNVVKLNLSSDMLFDCLNCKQPNKILFSYGAARVTTPLNIATPYSKPIPNVEE